MSTRLQKAVDEAARIFRMWHQKEPNGIEPVTYPLEDFRVFRAGVGDNILYLSDKWENDGDVWDYTHPFDSRPEVFTIDGDGDEGDVCELLDVPEVSARACEALPLLAGARELIIKHDDGSKRVIRFGQKRDLPVLACSRDKRGLVILTHDMGPIYIRGGKMHVTERGIHH